MLAALTGSKQILRVANELLDKQPLKEKPDFNSEI
jgi:hypothetical protein